MRGGAPRIPRIDDSGSPQFVNSSQIGQATVPKAICVDGMSDVYGAR